MPDLTANIVASYVGSGQPAFSTETRVGGYVVERPFFPEDSAALIITAPYQVELTAYAPPAPNASLSDYPGAVFCGDSPLTDLGLGLAAFIRTWATVPTARITPSTLAFTYPAYFDLRNNFSQTVTLKILDEFFLVGPGAAYATALDIPVIQESRVTFTTGGPYPLGGGVVLNNGGGVLDPSTPSITAYKALVTTDAATPSSFSLIPQPSTPERHVGNIWRRRTYRVKAL